MSLGDFRLLEFYIWVLVAQFYAVLPIFPSNTEPLDAQGAAFIFAI